MHHISIGQCWFTLILFLSCVFQLLFLLSHLAPSYISCLSYIFSLSSSLALSLNFHLFIHSADISWAFSDYASIINMQKSLSGWKTTSKHTQPCLSTHHPLSRVLLPFTVQPFEEESVLFTSIYLSSLLPQTSTVWLLPLLPLHVKGFPKAKDVLLVFRCYGNFSVVSCNIWGSPSEFLLDFQDMFLSLSLPFSPPHLLPPSLPSSPFLSLSLSLSCVCVFLSLLFDLGFYPCHLPALRPWVGLTSWGISMFWVQSGLTICLQWQY